MPVKRAGSGAAQDYIQVGSQPRVHKSGAFTVHVVGCHGFTTLLLRQPLAFLAAEQHIVTRRGASLFLKSFAPLSWLGNRNAQEIFLRTFQIFILFLLKLLREAIVLLIQIIFVRHFKNLKATIQRNFLFLYFIRPSSIQKISNFFEIEIELRYYRISLHSNYISLRNVSNILPFALASSKEIFVSLRRNDSLNRIFQTGTNPRLTGNDRFVSSHSSILSPLFHVVPRRSTYLFAASVCEEATTPTKIPPACPSIHIDERERDFVPS